MSSTHLSMHVICNICNDAKATVTLNYPDGSKIPVCMSCGEDEVKKSVNKNDEHKGGD